MYTYILSECHERIFVSIYKVIMSTLRMEFRCMSQSSAPSHYLNQCWTIVNWTFRNKLQWNFNRNSNIYIQEIAFENVVCKMASILSRPQWVKHSRLVSHLPSWVSGLNQTGYQPVIECYKLWKWFVVFIMGLNWVIKALSSVPEYTHTSRLWHESVGLM